MAVYHKLVRDLIPSIIEQSGKACSTRTLDDTEYLAALDAKLDEELAEYHAAEPEHALEELADLMEVIHAAAVARGYSLVDLESVRAEKTRKRGGFAHKIMLDEVTEPKEST